ncbi:hypothetical protein DYE50_04955 [Treponema ruminis]|uniref:Uncharacterized protein n=1 Tax=Treponema ruminis TaxID=744515 RepID=A0A7W8G7F4_9SPIR|nr:hypothetical protein [Treponema ruminis]MBB5225206.1 hypothetical protein [Treponema ruminis]QSI01924.1 hypothetical protein DYE50_04955 [Treponema ruminis]
MGVDIQYWYDNNISFSTIKDLKFHLERYLDCRISIFCMQGDSDEWFSLFPKTGKYKYTSLCSVVALNKSEYFLEIVDSDNKIKDFENQNISELFKTRQIELFLRSVLDDIEVYIYPKTLKIYSDFLCFPGRMFSFIETIENPEEGFTEDYLKILYRINSFVKAFNSNSILMVGDTQSINWENIDEDLEEGWTSISEVLEKYKPRGIKIITEEMVLNKQLEPCDNEEEVYNHVYFFQFNNLLEHLKPCEFREEDEEEEVYIEKAPAVFLEVSITDLEYKPEKPSKTALRIAKKLNSDYEYTTEKLFYNVKQELMSIEKLYKNRWEKFVERAKSLDFNKLTNYFKYSKGTGKVYALEYRNVDFSISASLWCPDKKEKCPKDFVSLIDEIFEYAANLPENCISFGSFRMVGVPVKTQKEVNESRKKTDLPKYTVEGYSDEDIDRMLRT